MIPKTSSKDSVLTRVFALVAFCLLAAGILVFLIRLKQAQRPTPAPPIPVTNIPAPTPSPEPTTPPVPPASTSTEASAPTSTSVTLHLNETATLANGATLKLLAIDDSRCKPNVQCIWAGELSAEVRYTDATGYAVVYHLGPISNPCDHGLTLSAITETTATLAKTASCK